MSRKARPRCKFCNQQFHKKGLANHERFCVKAHGSRHPMTESNTLSQDKIAIPIAAEIAGEQVLNALWSRLNLVEKIDAIGAVIRRGHQV